MRHRQLLTVACLASILGCILIPAAATASTGDGVGTISTFAGSPVFGPVGATSLGVPADSVASATLGGTTYAYVASDNVVRRIDLATGQEQVVAGNGGIDYAPDGTVATNAAITSDEVAVDANGDMAILDNSDAGGVRFVPASSGTYFGQAMTAGDIYTLSVSGGGSISAQAIALSPQGNLASSDDGVISFLSIAGGVKTAISSAGSNNLQAVAIDSAGDIAFLGPDGDEVELVPASSSGTYSGLSSKGTYFDISMPDAGTGYALVDHCDNDDCNGGGLGDGGYAPNASTGAPSSLAFDSQGNLVIGDGGNYRARFVPASSGTYYGQSMSVGDIYALAGNGTNGLATVPTDGALATSVDLPYPAGVSIDSSGDLVIGTGLTGPLLVSRSSDDIEAIAGNRTFGYSGDGSPGATAEFSEVGWAASDSRGDVAVVDDADSRIRFIPTVKGAYFGQSMNAGDIYTIAGNGIPSTVEPQIGGSGNLGSATAAAAEFSTFEFGTGIALDSAGDLFITDPVVNQVRFVPAQKGMFYGQSMEAGDVYSIGESSKLSDPSDVALDAAGNVFVADGDDVKEIAAGTGAQSTVVPSTASPEPFGIAVDSHGDIAVSNRFGNAVNFIPASDGHFYGQSMTEGTVYKIAGNGTRGYEGDGGQATGAELAEPYGLTFDSFGDLVIAQAGEEITFDDFLNPAVRFLPASTGTFYGQSMTLGDIYTIAGGHTAGFSGDGGLGTGAELSRVTSVTMAPGEDLLIADQYNNRVRVLSGSVPIATTGAAGAASETSDTVEGSVNPQGRPIGYRFDYGTTTAYGSSTPDSPVGSDHAEHPELQSLVGLAPGTVYHYRIVADYDQAGAIISVPGDDETFTTMGVKSGETTSEEKSTGGGLTTTGITTTAVTSGSTESPVAVASSPKAVEELLLGCSSGQLVLNDAYIHGGRVVLSGSAAKSLIGKQVKILFNEAKQVATAKVGANGQFATNAPLPPVKIREALTTRYSAEIGKVRSLHLKLTRRLLLEPPKASGTTITLSGQVTLPLTKPVALVVVEQQLECGKTTIAKTFTPPANGRFHLVLTVPANAKAGIFRLTSKVAANAHAVKHGFTTFSLPLPVALG